MILNINLSNLTSEAYAALVLAIIFTVATIASAIFFARHKETKLVVTILAAFVFPALAVFCWLYLILTVCDIALKWSLLYAFIGAIGYVIVAVAVAYAILAIIKARANRPVKVKETPVAEEAQPEETAETEETTEEEQVEIVETEETLEEEPEKIEDQSTSALLLTHTEELAEEPAEGQETEEENTETEETQAEEVETEEPAEENAEIETEEVADDGETVGGVVFSQETKESFAEQLSKLSEEMLGFYNEILEYAKTKDISMVKESRSHVIVKMGRHRLVEFKFIRGKLVSRFMAGSSELKNYSMSEKAVKIKEKPVMIEIVNENSVAVAKNMIDIVCKNILEAREAKEAEEVITPVAEEAPVEEVATDEVVETSDETTDEE